MLLFVLSFRAMKGCQSEYGELPNPADQLFYSRRHSVPCFVLCSGIALFQCNLFVVSAVGRLRRLEGGFLCRKTSLIRCTQRSEATSVSFVSCDRLRKPWGRSSAMVRVTGWPMSRSFLANITESSSRASSAEACVRRTPLETLRGNRTEPA